MPYVRSEAQSLTRMKSQAFYRNQSNISLFPAVYLVVNIGPAALGTRACACLRKLHHRFRMDGQDGRSVGRGERAPNI